MQAAKKITNMISACNLYDIVFYKSIYDAIVQFLHLVKAVLCELKEMMRRSKLNVGIQSSGIGDIHGKYTSK